MTKELLNYFNNDELAASVWLGKYALKNGKGEVVEQTPYDMHMRMLNELARTEAKHYLTDKYHEDLSPMGKKLWKQIAATKGNVNVINALYFPYLDKFRHIIPQGSIMSALGNFYKLQSLSNCFVVPAPLDSYGGIFKTDQEIAQLEKRRGGVGTHLNNLRPDDTPVLNAAGTSTGSHSFMDRYSNTTREVAQNGRRGALMLLMMVLHPDIFKFVTKKKDRTKVTGANVSTQIIDAFMKAVVDDTDFLCKFPIDLQVELDDLDHVDLPYNQLVTLEEGIFVMRIKARELYDLIVEMAWENAEPGVAFMDRVINYSPEGVYDVFKAIASNPCGEQWMQAYDACRLLAANMFSFVVNAYKKDAHIDYDKVYEVFYIQQRLADAIVDLEIEYVDKIIAKIQADPEPEDVKATELNLWKKVKETATASRRTGCGFTALADMLAALGLKYDSDEALDVTKKVMQTKMRAELDCTIDLAIMRGTFEGWDVNKEFKSDGEELIAGRNAFYQMILDEFPDQAYRMATWGRRNVSWSTVAPTGSVSIIAILKQFCNTSGGCEPHFLPFFFRNKKVNPSDKNVRVDFVDQNGDSWQTFPVVMGGFKEWWVVASQYEHNPAKAIEILESCTKEEMQKIFEQSPFYGSCANDISWEKRVEIQAILQRYTTNAISSTLNLPKDVTKSTVSNIYMEAWKQGLKGITVYRDGCRTGVLVSETKKEDGIVYHDAPKRPKDLDAELTVVTVKGKKYAVIVGFLNGKPYEIFAFHDEKNQLGTRKKDKGTITKYQKSYDYQSEGFKEEEQGIYIPNLGNMALHADEQMLTRLVSGMMRHGVNPKFIYQQIDKCELEVIGFGSALKRIIKKYIPEKELIEGQKCKDCGSTNIRLAEGCITCNDCGSSKCG